MELNYKDIFYNFIEAFIDIKKPENPLKKFASESLNEKSIKLYKDIDRLSLDYEKSSMIILDGKYFTDDAYLYFFPITVKNIIENNGLIEAIINRLKEIKLENYSDNRKELLIKMIDTLSELKVKMDSYHEDFILII